MKKFIYVVLYSSLAFLSEAVMAQTDFWQKINGPSGDTVNVLASNASGTIFAETNGGVFHSTNNGENWIKGYICWSVFVIDIAFNSTGNIFVGGYGGIFRSTY